MSCFSLGGMDKVGHHHTPLCCQRIDDSPTQTQLPRQHLLLLLKYACVLWVLTLTAPNSELTMEHLTEWGSQWGNPPSAGN